MKHTYKKNYKKRKGKLPYSNEFGDPTFIKDHSKRVSNIKSHQGKVTLSPKEKKQAYKDPGQYVESYAALIDKYIQILRSGKRIPFGVVFILVVLIYLYDIIKGNLENWENLLWTTTKCFYLIVAYIIYLVIHYVSQLFKNRKSRTK